MFELTHAAIDTESLTARLKNDEAGAFICFEGRVRNFNEGKEVLYLEYEAYEALALKEGERILQEAYQRFPIISASCVHRLGSLKLAEAAVWVAVLTRHRSEGFEACRFLIDEIKARLPIWKKEYYADGSSVWVNCAECASHRHTEVHS